MSSLTGISKITGVNKITFASGGGPQLLDLDFPVVTNWQESPANRWGPITGNTGEGKTNMSLGAGQDGYIQQEVNLVTGAVFTGLDFCLSNSPGSPYYGTSEYNVFVGSGNFYNWSYLGAINGYNDSGIPAQTGDILKTERVGDTFSAYYYRGGSWTLIHEWTQKSTAQAWVVGSSGDFFGGPVYCLNPKGYNIN